MACNEFLLADGLHAAYLVLVRDAVPTCIII